MLMSRIQQFVRVNLLLAKGRLPYLSQTILDHLNLSKAKLIKWSLYQASLL